MEPRTIAEQIFNFQKSLLLNARATTTALQEHGEKMTKIFVEPFPHIPEETKTMVNAWIETVKKNQKDMENLQDEGFASLERYVLENS